MVQPPNKLSQLYSALKSHNILVPDSEEVFARNLSDRTKSDKLYAELKKLNIALPDSQQGFYDNLFPPSKKKDSTDPVSSGSPDSDRASLVNVTPEQQQAIAKLGQPKQSTLFTDKQEQLLKDKTVGKQPEGFVDNVTADLSQIPPSFNKGVVGAATVIPKTVGIIGKQIDELVGNDKPLESYPSYQAGKWLEDKALELGITATDPTREGFWNSTIPQAFGQVIGTLFTGGRSLMAEKGLEKAITTPLGDLGKTLSSAPAISGALQVAVPEYEAAKASGMDDGEAFNVFLKNIPGGLTEVLPLANAFGRINKITKGGIVGVLKTGTVNGIEEATQEAVQQYYSNVIAQGSYDPARDPMNGVLEGSGAGFFVGFVLPGLATAMQGAPESTQQQVSSYINEKLKEVKEQNIEAPQGDLETALQEGIQKYTQSGVNEANVQENVPDQNIRPQPDESQQNIRVEPDESNVTTTEIGETSDQTQNEGDTKVEIQGFTEAETVNRDYRALKEKLGEKKARKYFNQVDNLLNPNQNTIVEYRENGVVTKEGDKYTFHALSDTDLKNWRVGFTQDVTDQFVQESPQFTKAEQGQEVNTSSHPINSNKDFNDRLPKPEPFSGGNLYRYNKEKPGVFKPSKADGNLEWLSNDGKIGIEYNSKTGISELTTKPYKGGGQIYFEDEIPSIYKRKFDEVTAFLKQQTQTQESNVDPISQETNNESVLAKEPTLPSDTPKTPESGVDPVTKGNIPQFANQENESIQPQNQQQVSDQRPAQGGVTETSQKQPTSKGADKQNSEVGTKIEFEWVGVTKRGTVIEKLPDGRVKIKGEDGTIYRVKDSGKPLPSSSKDLSSALDNIVNRAEAEKSSVVKKKGDILAVNANPVFYVKKIWDSFNKAQELLFGNSFRRVEGWASKKINKGLQSRYSAVRTAVQSLRNVIGGLPYQHNDIKNKLEFTGNKNYGHLKAKMLADDMYKIIDSDVRSLERVHQVLDPDMFDSPVQFNDLTDTEKQLHDIIRKSNDFIHEWSYSNGFIAEETYNKYKDKYIARLYEDFELTPAEVEQAYKSSRADFTMYKQRKEGVELELLKDPVYATAKRMAQIMQNQAIFDYADAIVKAGNVKVSDTEFPGSVKMGEPGQPFYGSLSGKYVPSYLSEDFKGFFFLNKALQNVYSAFRGYDKNVVRQFLKRSKTVYSPLVQLGNLLSNYSFAFWTGVDPMTFTVNKVKANKQIKTKGADYMDLVHAGIIGADVATGDLIPMQQSATVPTSTLGKAKDKFIKLSEKASELYGKTDDVAKLSAYISLQESGYTKEQALDKVYEGFQNYATVGKVYDFASKTPIVGNPYIKFKGDLMRILKNSITRRPLTMILYVSMLKYVGDLLSDASGEDDDVQRARERRAFIPKIKTPMGDVPLVWQVPGVGEVNFARFISPYYIYDKGEKDDMVSDVTEWLPYQFEMAQLSRSRDIEIPIPDMADVFLGTYAQVLWDRDFRGMSIRDPKGNEHITVSTPEEQIGNALQYISRSQIPFFRSGQDMLDAYNGESDYYGRERTVSQAILNNIIKVQEFGSEQAKENLEKEIKYKISRFEAINRDVSQLKSLARKEIGKIQSGNLAGKETLIKKEYDLFNKRLAGKLADQVKIVKELEEPRELLRAIQDQ